MATMMSALVRSLPLGWTLVVLAATAAAAESLKAQVSETQVRAVFLLRFTEFVEWPPSAFDDSEAAACIGVFGEDLFGAFLDSAVQGELLEGRPIEVRRFNQIDLVGSCQVLFVGRSEAERLREIVEALAGRSVLTVGDSEGFARLGGMIEFGTVDGRTRLTINPQAAREANLTISSRLLRAAAIVEPSGQS